MPHGVISYPRWMKLLGGLSQSHLTVCSLLFFLFLTQQTSTTPTVYLLSTTISSFCLQHPTKTVIMTAEKAYNTAFDLVGRFKGLKGKVWAQLRGSAEGSKVSSAGTHIISSSTFWFEVHANTPQPPPTSPRDPPAHPRHLRRQRPTSSTKRPGHLSLPTSAPTSSSSLNTARMLATRYLPRLTISRPMKM